MTNADDHEPLPAADADPAPEADLRDAGPGPAPERAMRRVRPGIGLGTLAAVAVLASTSVGVGTHLALSEDVQAPLVAPAASAPELPDAADLALVRAQLTTLADDVDEARLQKLSATGDEMQSDLATALPKLMLEIRVARDARLKRGDRKRLAGPFTSKELEGVLATVRATPKGDRLVTDRDGNIVAPVGAKAPEGVELAATGSAAAVKVWTLGDGRARTLVARRCLVKEMHCLVELRDIEVPAVDVSSASAALDRAGSVDAALRDAVAAVAAPPPATAHTPRSATPVVAGGLAGLLAAFALGFFVRRQLREQSAAVAGYASAIAAGSDDAPPRRTAGELVSAVEALIVVARQRDDDRARAEDEQARRERWSAWSSQLDRVAEGALDARLAPSGDAMEISVAEGVNRVVASLDQRVAQLQRHLTALAPDKASDVNKDAPADDAKDNLHKRIEAIRPLAGLLGDIGTRLKALAAAAEEGTALQRDLARLGEAVGTRATTAAGLVSALEHDVGQLEQPRAPSGEGLSPQAQAALVALTADLGALGVAPSLAHQLAAEGRFTWAA